MDTYLVRVVCTNCDANYRIAAEMVSGKVVDYCCSNCGAVIEVNGMAIELVAPTRPGQDPRDLLPRTPAPTNVAPSSASFRVNAPSNRAEAPAYRSDTPAYPPPSYPSDAPPYHQPPAYRADTPAGLVRVKPPPPPSTETFASRRPQPVHSSMPPAMSMPPRETTERPVQVPNDIPPMDETPAFAETRAPRRGWLLAVATLVAAVAVALIGRTLSSLANAPSEAAQAAQPAEPPTPVSARLQASDFRGTATDPAQPSATAIARPSTWPTEVSVESLKPEKRRKKAKSVKPGAEEPEPAAEEAVAEPAPAPTPTFVAPEPPPPPGPEFSKEAAQSALEDAAALAATCRQDETTAGAVRVAVTFVPSGQATVAVVESGVVRGTPVGSCVAAKFRTAKVPPFSGTKVTVHKTMMF